MIFIIKLLITSNDHIILIQLHKKVVLNLDNGFQNTEDL